MLFAWAGTLATNISLYKSLPFHPVNDARALQRMGEWLSAPEWVAMLQDNPARLYDF